MAVFVILIYNKILHIGLQKRVIYLAPNRTSYKLLKYFTTYHLEKKHVTNFVLTVFITSYRRV
jgi:hypothetical protein